MLIHPYGHVILVPLKKCLLQFPVSVVYEFFQGTFIARGHLPCRSLLVSKIIYMSICI